MTQTSITPKERELFYGRRLGRALRHNRQAALEGTATKLALPLDALATPAELFDTPVTQLWLEVGFGNGEHAIAQLHANPTIGLIGCEPFLNGVSALALTLEEPAHQPLQPRIRIHANDARPVIDALPDASLDRVFVLFPDPWRKKRHYERRFIGEKNLERLARVIKPGGELRCATDHENLGEWMTEHLRACPHFIPHPDGGIMHHHPDGWPYSRYEEKALEKGLQPTYFRFVRR